MRKGDCLYFSVIGQGGFPADMLRYDSCFPATTDDADSIVMPAEHADFVDLRVVVLGHRYTGFQVPTEGRWHSFTWRVIETQTFPTEFLRNPEQAFEKAKVRHQLQMGRGNL